MNSPHDVGLRLQEERLRLGLKQFELAERVGVSKTTQHNYEAGMRSPDAQYLAALAAAGGDVSYVITGERTAGVELEAEFVEIPRYAAVASAGPGALNEPAASYHAGGLAIPAQWLRRRRLSAGNLKAIEVRGVSMTPLICDGDLVVIDTSDTEPRGGFIYALRHVDELMVKYVTRIESKVLLLSSANSSFPPYQIDLERTPEVEVLGRVVASMHEW